MRPLAAILAALVIVSLSSALQIENPQLVNYASVIIDENGTVSVLGAQIRSLDINLSMPLSSAYQDIQINEQVRQDSEGNQYIKIFEQSPPNPFHYSKRVAVQTRARATPALPISYMVPVQYSRFTAPSARTQSDDPQIRSLALSLTANSTSPFERVARLAIFVNRHMTYNEQLVGEEKDALWALRNAQGVCVEYSTLFAALARSIGIPVRYINGYVYSEKYGGWLGHAWAEAYVGEWVPVDPTWFEVGSLDALHIEAGKYREVTRDPSLIATISDPSAQIIWDTTGKSGAFANNIFTQDIDSGAPDSDYQLKLVETELAPGSTTLAYAVFTGKDYRVVPLVLAGCTGGESVSVSGSEQYAILEPGKKTVVAWELYAAENVPKNYVFTCPLTLNSPSFASRRLDVRVDPRLSSLGPLQASLEKTSVAPGDENSALFTLPYSRQGKNYVVLTPHEVYSSRISSSSGSIPFYTVDLGSVPVYAAAQGGGFAKLEYISGSNNSLSIDSIAVPEYAVEGKTAFAAAKVSSKNYPADVQVEFSTGYQIEKKAGRISAPADFEFEFVPAAESDQKATVRLYGDGGLADEENALVKVIAAPTLAISGVRVAKAAGGLEAEISFSKTGKPISPTLSIGGGEYGASEEATVRLPAGAYEAVLRWSDAAGNTYEKSEQVEIAEPGIFEDLGGKAKTGGTPSCPAALILLASALGFAFVKR